MTKRVCPVCAESGVQMRGEPVEGARGLLYCLLCSSRWRAPTLPKAAEGKR